jgi:hypothetical protein
LHIAGALGFRRFKIHGFDHSMRGGDRHAASHLGIPQNIICWKVGRRFFLTSKIMVNAAFECVDTFKTFPIEGELKGDGLLQEMVRSGKRGEAWRISVPSTRASRPLIPV